MTLSSLYAAVLGLVKEGFVGNGEGGSQDALSAVDPGSGRWPLHVTRFGAVENGKTGRDTRILRRGNPRRRSDDP